MIHIPVNRSRYWPTYLSTVSAKHPELHTLCTSVAKLSNAAGCSSVSSGISSSTCTQTTTCSTVNGCHQFSICSVQFVCYNLQICEKLFWWLVNVKWKRHSRRMAVSFLTVPPITRSRTSSMESWDPTRGSSSRKRFLLPTQQAQSEIRWFHCSVNWNASLLRCDNVLMGTVVADILDNPIAFIFRVKQKN